MLPLSVPQGINHDEALELEARRLERQKLLPYLRHTSDCCGMLAGGPINRSIEHHCTCGLHEALSEVQ